MLFYTFLGSYSLYCVFQIAEITGPLEYVDDDVMGILAGAGITQRPTVDNKQQLSQSVIKHHLVYRVAACVNQFKIGMTNDYFGLFIITCCAEAAGDDYPLVALFNCDIL